MEENNILNKNNKKKILIGSIIIVMVLLLVVVGSTYAYFSMRINGEGTSTNVTIITGSSKQIKLSGGLEDFHIKLDVKDMAYNRIDSEYYATSNEKLNYVTDEETGLTEIGKVEVTGELEERHTCTASVNVNIDGDMANLIKKGDLELSLKTENYTRTLDLKEITETKIAELEFILDNTKPIEDKSIKAYLKFTNRNDDQSYLINKTLNVNIIIDDFKCTTDTVAPEISNFYINKDNEENYTKEISNTAYITWTDEDVKEYCITNKEGSNNCTTWEKAEGNQVQKQIELSQVEGEQTYYVYLKDNAGNISTGNRYATIVYDVTPPTITNVEAPNPQETSLTLNITGNDDKEGVNKTSGIDKYCYSTKNSTNEGDYECVTNANIVISNLKAGTSYTYYIYAKDKAGNSGITTKKEYTFKTNAKPAGDYVKDYDIGTNGVKTLQDDPIDGLYRYVGTATDVTNNYICFGTTDVTQCTKTNPQTYMYRIIGITSEADNTLGLNANQLKIIKATPFGSEQLWHNSYSNIKWDAADIKTYLNGTSKSTQFLYTIQKGTDGTYWDSMISSHKWYNADYASVPAAEPTTSTTTNSKIGLIYATDYQNSGDQNTTNWLFIKNGWSTNSSLSGFMEYEWTMSRYGNFSGFYGAWAVATGSLYGDTLPSTLAVRPVFYLTPNITLTGEGTEGNPFIINS